MSAAQIGLLAILAVCVLIYAGVHITVALGACSFVAVWAINGSYTLAAKLFGISAAEGISSYEFAVVPLFCLMALLVGVADVATESFKAANYLLRRIKGGVGIATVLGNAILSAVTGVTIASVAIFTKLAVPEMLRLGYRPRFAVGVVAGSGVLGMFIPPSLLMILYCVVTETSLGKLFLAAFIPGALLTFLLSLGIMFMAWKWPSFVGTPEQVEDKDAMSALAIAKALAPAAGLVLLVFGGIYGGFFTATEAGATGALGALVLALARRRLTWTRFYSVLQETGLTTSAILILIISATFFGRMLVLSGLPGTVTGWLIEARLSFTVMIVLYVLLLLFLGTFLDSMSTILLSVPLLFPAFLAYGVDPIWFGVITILATEMGIVTPPFGISAFVVKSTLADQTITLEDIYAGSYPFLAIMFFTLILLIAFPVISTGILK